MPKLLQPARLQDTAYDTLVGFILSCYDRWTNDNDSLDKFRECSTFVKENVCTCLPQRLLTVFCYELVLELCFDEGNLASHDRAVLEITMDLEIDKLPSSPHHLLDCISPSETRRFRGIKELVLDYSPETITKILNNFRLQDIARLEFLSNCTDTHLEAIGLNCPKLKWLGVLNSEKITDNGLRALGSCPELRYLDVSNCRRLSIDGIYEFLAVHEKMRELVGVAYSEDEDFDSFSYSNLDAAVYPSLDCFGIQGDFLICENLRCIVSKFPNLNSLEISGHVAGDLTILRYLNKLSKLDVSFSCGLGWDNLKELWAFIGDNISEFKANVMRSNDSCPTQNDVNFIFKFCRNIEVLEFSYWPDSSGQKLVVPPFEKLKVLDISVHHECRYSNTNLEFGQMLSLERLSIEKFYVSTKMIKSMILDNAKFPNLKTLVGFYEILNIRDIIWVRQILRSHNLDVTIVRCRE